MNRRPVGSTPFHSCVEVRSPKLVSSEDRTGARAPSASYCSTEGVAPLHTAPPVPVTAPPVPDIVSGGVPNSILSKTVSLTLDNYGFDAKANAPWGEDLYSFSRIA